MLFQVLVQKTNHKITPFFFSHFRSLKLPLRDTVHCVHTRMTGVLHIGLETGEFLLRRVTVLDERIVALADERVDLLVGNSQSLPRALLTEHLRNLGKLWVMYGRRPRCKRNLTISEAFGCGHVWTAPAVQEESDYQRSVRVRSCMDGARGACMDGARGARGI